MKLNYFPDTDSLYIDLSHKPSVESQEVSEGVVLDYDAEGNLVGIDIDHASSKLDLRELVTNHIPLRQRRRILSPVFPLQFAAGRMEPKGCERHRWASREAERSGSE